MGKIKIENFTFTYPDCEQAAIFDINATVKSGEFVVLLGHSGSGKTTLLSHLKKEMTPKSILTVALSGKMLRLSEPFFRRELSL